VTSVNAYLDAIKGPRSLLHPRGGTREMDLNDCYRNACKQPGPNASKVNECRKTEKPEIAPRDEPYRYVFINVKVIAVL
jgi:hypothetical protein